MATPNQYFNPWLERLRAGGENFGNFLIHPTDQSVKAAQVARDLWANQADAMRPTSPMQPYMRPGVDPDALTPDQLKLLQQRGLLGQ